jgi:hypothetical protein
VGSGLATQQIVLQKQPMARPLRLAFSGAVYHLTSRGNARQRIFFTDQDREQFLRILSGVVRRIVGFVTPTV